MWDDVGLDRSRVARQFLLFERELLDLETAFLHGVAFDLTVSPSDYARHYFALRSASGRGAGLGPMRPMPPDIALRLQRQAPPTAAGAQPPEKAAIEEQRMESLTRCASSFVL